MTKKKRGHPDAEEILARPWCYYCERDFDDLKALILHQKAKHFKCERCGRRLNTAGGLSVHMTQVHKENLDAVENALPNRSGLGVEIFGMEGIPEDIIQQHNQRVLTQFHQAEAERRANTGNPAPGTGGPAGPKKPKVEGSGDLKARLAAFKAKKAAAAAGISSGNGTPTGAGQASPGSATPQSPGPPQQSGMSGYAPPQYIPQGGPPPASFQQPFVQPGYGMPPQQPPFPQPQSPFNRGGPVYGAPPQQAPPGMNQFLPYPQPPYVVSPPPGMFQQNNQQAPQALQNGSFSRPPGLPAPPGLPQRPAFGAPTVNPSQMQQMHHGQHLGQNNAPNAANLDPRIRPQEFAQPQLTATEADVDDLIANAAAESSAAQTEEIFAVEPAAGKKSKKDKDKDKATKMIYDDNEVSPEEKMAKMSRYAFDPSDSKPETVLGDAIEPAVTGPVVGENDVLDPSG